METRKSSKTAGSSFDSWRGEQGEESKVEVIAGAMKRQFVMKLRTMMKVQGIGVNAPQKMLGTGPSQIQRAVSMSKCNKVKCISPIRVTVTRVFRKEEFGWAFPV